MDWSDDDQPPTRTRDELLAHVERRGDDLRRRRRAGRALAGVAAVLAVTALGGLATIDDDQGGAVQVATDGPSGTAGPETLSEPSVAEPWPALAPPGIPMPGPPPVSEPPPSTIPGQGSDPSMPTTTSAATTPTVPAAPTTATTPTTTRGSTTTPPSTIRGPRCRPDQLAVAASPSKPEYRPGEKVVVTSTVRNRSSTPCYHNSYSFRFEFTAPDGRSLIGGDNHADGFNEQSTLAPGQWMTEIADWYQLDCADSAVRCVQAAPGTYTATVSWSLEAPPVEATTSFQLVP